ncbi:MAG: hypothetical protein Q8O99_00345 [bacterium]|nr:hypothetical protein [bacterium]
MMQPKPQSNKLISPEEKQALLTRLTSTMHDLGRLPGLIFAPVIAFVSTHYAKIPTERKGHLQKILDEIKAGSGEGVEKLKVRLKDMVEAAKKKAKEKAKEARQ